MFIETQEKLQLQNKTKVHHWTAGIIICLFSLYYSILQSQSYDIGLFNHYSFYVQPKLLQYYKPTYGMYAHKGYEQSGYHSYIRSFALLASRPQYKNGTDIAFNHSLTYILFLRNLNRITGHTIVSGKLLVLPKLLIYLLGMYAFLYHVSKRTYPSLLVSLISIVSRIGISEVWGPGIGCMSEAKTLVNIFLPWILVVFLKSRRRLTIMCFIYLITGCLGNIHAGAALNIVLMLSFTQILTQKNMTDKIKYAIIPMLCFVLGAFPFMMSYMYNQIVSGKAAMVIIDLKNIHTLRQIPLNFQQVFSLEVQLQLIYPFFNLYTLILFLPLGIYYFKRNYEDNSTKKIILVQLCYTLLFFLVGCLFIIFKRNMGGYIGYLIRTHIFTYIFLYLFVTFAIVWLTEIVETFFTNSTWKPNVAKLIITVLIILVIFPPIGIKPNTNFPSYNIRKQIKDIKGFFSNGIIIGAINEHFTRIAYYIKNSTCLPEDAKYTTRNCDAFILLTHKPTYEIPPKAVTTDNKLIRYDYYKKLIDCPILRNFLLKILNLDKSSYEDLCMEFINEVTKYIYEEDIDYVLINSRYRNYLNENLEPVLSNPGFILCRKANDSLNWQKLNKQELNDGVQ